MMRLDPMVGSLSAGGVGTGFRGAPGGPAMRQRADRVSDAVAQRRRAAHAGRP